MTERSAEAVTAQHTGQLFALFFAKYRNMPGEERGRKVSAILAAAPAESRAALRRYVHCCEVVWDGAKDFRRKPRTPRPGVVASTLVEATPAPAQAAGQAGDEPAAQAAEALSAQAGPPPPAPAALPMHCGVAMKRLFPNVGRGGGITWVWCCAKDCGYQWRQPPGPA